MQNVTRVTFWPPALHRSSPAERFVNMPQRRAAQLGRKIAGQFGGESGDRCRDTARFANASPGGVLRSGVHTAESGPSAPCYPSMGKNSGASFSAASKDKAAPASISRARAAADNRADFLACANSTVSASPLTERPRDWKVAT